MQKTFTADFLTKRKQKNNGEVPQYYVNESHEAIIPPGEFEDVQIEMARCKEIGRSYSGNALFSSKIVYGDVNCDGYVRIDDVVLLNRFVAEDAAVTVSVQGIANAQCYADGEIDGKDATMLLQYLVGAISYDALGAPIQ